MNKNGFTLIELLIYLAIVSAVLVLTTAFLWNIIWGNVKETAFEEIQQNGRFALTKITQEIKRAKSIVAPLLGQSQGSLLLEMADGDLNPTIFDLDQGQLRITQGDNPPSFLTSDRALVSSLLFSNFSYPNTPGTIKVEINISHFNPENRPEYQASLSLESTVSLLPGLAP